MGLTEIVKRACQEETLVDALVIAAIWEGDRIAQQAKEFQRTGVSTAAYGNYDMCFGVIFRAVADEWNDQHESQLTATRRKLAEVEAKLEKAEYDLKLARIENNHNWQANDFAEEQTKKLAIAEAEHQTIRNMRAYLVDDTASSSTFLADYYRSKFEYAIRYAETALREMSEEKSE